MLLRARSAFVLDFNQLYKDRWRLVNSLTNSSSPAFPMRKQGGTRGLGHGRSADRDMAGVRSWVSWLLSFLFTVATLILYREVVLE